MTTTAVPTVIDGGGRMHDLDKLKFTVILHDIFDADPLGYMAGAAKIKDEVIELSVAATHVSPARGALADACRDAPV